MSQQALLGAAAAVLIAGLALGGYAIGSSSAPDASDARASREAAFEDGYSSALVPARNRARAKAHDEGLARGRQSGERDGASAGRQSGEADASAELAAAQPPPPAPATSGLTYTDQLPHGEPGYVLPPGQRTLSCVGYDADTGQCVGD
jgi:hypothetical protein